MIVQRYNVTNGQLIGSPTGEYVTYKQHARFVDELAVTLREVKRCVIALQETGAVPPDTCAADLHDMVTDALAKVPASREEQQAYLDEWKANLDAQTAALEANRVEYGRCLYQFTKGE